MANGYNPYQIAGSQTGFLEELMRADQIKKEQDVAIGQLKGEMTREFEAEQIRKQKEFEAIQAQKRKKNPWEKLLPIAAMFSGPIAGAVMSAVGGIGSMKADVKSEKEKLAQMEALGLGSSAKYGGTFLGSKARAIESEAESAISAAREDISGIGRGDYLMKAVMEGIKGYGSGKMGEGIKGSFKGLKTGDVVAGKDAKILRAADKTGAKDMLTKITDAEGYSIDPTFQGDIFPNLSENQISMLDDFMKKTGAQSYEEAISIIMDLQGKETLWESLRGAYADNKLGETFKGEDADALKNFIAQLGLIGGGI